MNDKMLESKKPENKLLVYLTDRNRKLKKENEDLKTKLAQTLSQVSVCDQIIHDLEAVLLKHGASHDVISILKQRATEKAVRKGNEDR